jgi:hypothetical protein
VVVRKRKSLSFCCCNIFTVLGIVLGKECFESNVIHAGNVLVLNQGTLGVFGGVVQNGVFLGAAFGQKKIIKQSVISGVYLPQFQISFKIQTLCGKSIMLFKIGHAQKLQADSGLEVHLFVCFFFLVQESTSTDKIKKKKRGGNKNPLTCIS